MAKYRARGIWNETGRDSWVTTVWRKSEKEAKEDIAAFCNPGRYKKSSLRIIKK